MIHRTLDGMLDHSIRGLIRGGYLKSVTVQELKMRPGFRVIIDSWEGRSIDYISLYEIDSYPGRNCDLIYLFLRSVEFHRKGMIA